MLTLKFNETDNLYTVDRVSFPVPMVIDFDRSKELRDNVFAVADDYLLDKVAADFENKDEDEEDEKREKRKAINDSGLRTYGDSSDRFAIAIAIGLGWTKADRVADEFAKVWDLSRKYARTYADVTEWTDERKAEFTAIKTAMVDCIKSIAGDWWQMDTFKLSSKHVNAFINQIYTVTRQTKKGERASKFQMAKVEKAFSIYMMVMNEAMGIRFEEKKVVYVKMF